MNPQQQQQQESLLKAIAISSLHLPGTTLSSTRQEAFTLLQDFQQYSGRIAICLEWLVQATPIQISLNNSDNKIVLQDITVATKLLALEIVTTFLVKGGYTNLESNDRFALRQAILKSCRVLIDASSNTTTTNTTTSYNNGTRIMARKLATVLEGLLIRDFPQRWTTLVSDVFVPHNQGGLWYNQPGVDSGRHVGVTILLECLKLTAEDCADSDFNVQISTTRRNDVLKGLNEVAGSHILPLLFQLLEHYPLLQETSRTIASMHHYLIQQNRTVSDMTPDEAAQYQQQVTQEKELASMLADTLTTLQRFCTFMPLNWIMGSTATTTTTTATATSSSTDTLMTTTTPNFMIPFLFLMREPVADIQILAVECLDQIVSRGKLTFIEWCTLLEQLPTAIQDANQYYHGTIQEQERVKAQAQNGTTTTTNQTDQQAMQLGFHRALSRLLSNCLSCYIPHITSNKQILNRTGEKYDMLFQSFVSVVVDVLNHPSGRVCTEQLNMWTTLMRDPQIVKTSQMIPIDKIVSCFLLHMVKIRWEDVDEQIHPQTQLIEAGYDDSDEYDSWMADFRSRSSLLFKFAANMDPLTVSSVLNARFQTLLRTHCGGVVLLDHLDPSNGQVTPNSTCVTELEGLVQPLENALGGIPAWALVENDASTTASSSNNVNVDESKRQAIIRQGTQAALTELATALVQWEPTHLWLKFRRASLLDSLKHFWLYHPSTLLPAIDSLLRNLGLADEWRSTGQQQQHGTTPLSGEIVGLKKKSGVTLVSVSKMVPHHLVPWLSQLSEATNNLLSSTGLIPTNQMHLYEFLTCIATAVTDPVARSNFIANVLSFAVETLESTTVQQQIASVPALLEALGVTQASIRPSSVTDPENVRQVTGNYNRIFTAMNQLLSVGRRCNEATRKKAPLVVSLSSEYVGQSNFPDEGPVSLNDLAVNDPFVLLWPRILPALLQVTEVVLGVWRPEHQAALLTNPYQRYLFAISDDEAFLSKKHDSKSGGVFGENGTAGSVVAGANRRDVNLVPKWSGWFNELRNTCFQMFGLVAAQRVVFAPEIANLFPRMINVLTEPGNIRSMEHRHFIQFQKHVIEFFMISCPATLYQTHLEPLLSPIFEHIRYRMEKTWLPILSPDAQTGGSTRALTSNECSNAAAIAQRGGDEYFAWYYAHCGLFVGDLDAVIAEAAVEKSRVELSRYFSDTMQAALALKGEWALVLANQAKEEQAQKKNDASRLTTGPVTRRGSNGGELNADGTPKTRDQSAVDARKLLRINGLCHFLLLESESIAGSLTVTIVQCLGYPDAYTCRRTTKICHRILETVAWSPQYAQLLGQHMLTQAIKNVVTEPKWMVGIEWDMINVIRDIYCRLVLGQTLQFGGQGPAQQQTPVNLSGTSYEQAKTVDQPLQGGGILVVPSEVARQVMLSLPGTSPASIQEFESEMKTKLSAKDQKDFIRDLLRISADKLTEMAPSVGTSGTAAAGVFDRAIQEESLLHSHTRTKAVPDLPEKLVLHSQVMKSRSNTSDEPQDLSLQLFDS